MKTYQHQTVFSGPIVDIEQFDVEIGTKGRHTFQVIRHPGGAGVLPVHADGSVTLIRQLRPAVATHLLEIPAGRLAPGEDPELCAGRELLEETGLHGAELISLGKILSSPGVFDEVIHLFAAVSPCAGVAQPEDDEEIETVKLALSDALQMASDGRIEDAKTVAALFRWAHRCCQGNCGA